MEIHDRPKLLYPSMVIAAIAVTIFSLLGIATITGVLPSAHSEMRDASLAGTQADYGSMTQEKLAAVCPSCGIVESIRVVQVNREAGDIGVAAGSNGIGRGNGRSIAMLTGNEIEKNTWKRTSYRIRVRMADNSIRTLFQRQAPAFSSGDRVKIVGGSLVLQS
ncbi:MAG: hypothetical protein WAO76_01130 [Georgfuchsia sp.]